ncbi:hypothetical protein COV53_06405 [Candidatus Gottesmanbacteria bacterium CG11_big_fil_rev_8_21_14_0_20_37_11]|uniref:DUF4446 domain-containing protein n=3 Tax=Candidatus Gottesmaniibacteriota TaxID=1752720 RepID=A0A2M7RRF8_9BACT|nr:MAG: hypothetical protein AUJ73_00195 [Candidatus Gottesmanbacteria bacterium CG1_02_37_22]PIP33149.1 MAG: hypothetical protein COX23_00900 [Candidatus Gottesmanbacteria bacterium CG23_combo_of_CG06-09_8_20_14_all_37_19]PIR07798.1 MAG: hypothetical protein COV53_06405 [Candidatus Gottesmanbacteria bacterium CG11_big_fil_rev_8_21_14_0_20_37_11]PIZ02862.1 MAG: hypothetical protein COY59_02515 [Candidatus Gottesmanbacteria bacterium CG_4_10_14_0_8_um_filter_37_24]
MQQIIVINSLFGIILLWLCILSFYLYKLISRYKNLLKGIDKDSLTSVLEKVLKDIDLDRKDIETIISKVDDLEKRSVFYIQKVGIMRFNPFSDTGGDQSFILAILDEMDNGVVISSLHTRGITRWYAKNIESGKGLNYDLSKEELEAIKNATTLKKKNRRN